MSIETFSVCQFFSDDTNEYLLRNVEARAAFDRFMSATSSVGAKIGTTSRVIITDNGDNINAEWVHGKGLIYPPDIKG